MATTKTKPGQEPSTPFELRPPDWITKATRNGDLGYHGFFPPRPGQEEDILSENNIRLGYTEPHLVAGELWQGTDTFGGVFKQEAKNGLQSLQDIMERVLAKRAELHATVEENTFKLPARVTLAGDKRVQWYADLANSDVPLQKLAKNVPHGKKDQDLLEFLFTNKTPVDRAVWYIRCLGAIEIQARHKTSAQPVTSTEWTNVITTYIKKQLLDIAMPTTTRTGTNIKQSFKKSKLNDPEWKETWVARFAYSIDLLHLLFEADLIDQVALLNWLTATSSIGEGMAPHQLMFLVRLAHEYFDVLVCTRLYATSMVESCLVRFAEVHSSASRQYANYILDGIASLVLRMFSENVDLFMSRVVLLTYPITLQEALSHAIRQLDIDLQPKIKEEIMARYTALIERGNAIVSIDLPHQDEAIDVETRLQDIALLNTIDIRTDLSKFAFLPVPVASSTGSFELRTFWRRLSILLSWATDRNQSGSRKSRPYCAATLISVWKTQAVSVLPMAKQILQRYLLTWIEERGFLQPSVLSDSLKEQVLSTKDVEASAVLFGDLARRRLFSFSDYLTRMTGYGQGSTSTPRSEGGSNLIGGSPGYTIATPLGHLELLRCIPLWDKVSEQLLSQRKIVLYGIRARKTVEDAMEKEIRAELRRVVPLFFNGPPFQEQFSRNLLPRALAATKFVQTRVLYHWLLDLVKDYIHRTATMSTFPATVYSILLLIFSWTSCHRAILELNELLLKHTADDELLLSILNSTRQFLDIWVYMSEIDKLAGVLLDANSRLKEQMRKSPKRLLMLLSEIKQSCALSGPVIARIVSELEEAQKLLLSDSSSPAPPIFPLIQAAIQENCLEQPDSLATTLWYKNRGHSDWGTVAWNAIVSAIESKSWFLVSDEEMAKRFAALIWSIDAHLPYGVEEIIWVWFESNGIERMVRASDDLWVLMKETCLTLVLGGVVSPGTLLRGLVYPAWQYALNSHAADAQLGRSLGLMNTLLRCIPYAPHSASDPVDSQLLLETCRARCVHPSNLMDLAGGLFTLTVLRDNNVLGDAIRERIERFIAEIEGDPFIQDEVLSRTDLLRSAFDTATKVYPGHRMQLIANVRACLVTGCTIGLTGDRPVNASRWTEILSSANLWSFSRLALDLQLLFEQLRHSSTGSTDNTMPEDFLELSMDSLAFSMFHYPLSARSNAIMVSLFRGVDKLLSEKVVLHGLEQLARQFKSDEDDSLAFLDRSKEIFRLVIKFHRTLSTPAKLEWQNSSKAEFLQCWMTKISNLKVQLEATQPSRGQEMDDIAESISFMLRIFHFYLELADGELGNEFVGVVTSMLQLSLIFGGAKTLDDLTFSLLVDTICILVDDCAKDTKQAVNKALSEQFPNSDLPSELPNSTRRRLTPLLPFIPKDKFGANLARALRSSDGTLTCTSKLRGRPWEWMDSIEPREDPPLLSTKVKNTSAMPLEVFETTNKGETVIPGDRIVEASEKMEDIWNFRDHVLSEGLVGRYWRESKSAWDTRSLDGSERISPSTRGLSPAASRSSAHVSTSSRKGSPSIGPGRMHSINAPTVEAMEIESAEGQHARGLKRKERADELDDDVFMLDSKTVTKSPVQAKRGKARGKTKR